MTDTPFVLSWDYGLDISMNPVFTDEELEYLWFAIQNYQPFDFNNKEECDLYHKVYKKIDNYFLSKAKNETD